MKKGLRNRKETIKKENHLSVSEELENLPSKIAQVMAVKEKHENVRSSKALQCSGNNKRHNGPPLSYQQSYSDHDNVA